MGYKVLYRKYRPNSFNDVVGQEATVKILKNSIINDKISHAYLFAGPRGTGKTSMARIFAKVINCLNPINGEACDECINCQNFNSSPDIIEIDAASNNGVDEIRELINNVKIMPTTSKYKVYIIDEVHMLSQSAFNALLLTLEEPPSHVIFILATTNIENVPITIISRCQKYEFFRISNELITERLQKICKLENISYDIEGLNELSSLADGGLRDALSMLDQLSKEKEKITLDLVIKELGSISMVKIQKLLDELDEGNINETLKILNELKKTNLNYKIVIKKIIELLSKKAIFILENNNYKILDYSIIKKMILELNDCLNKINININPYVLIEMILLTPFAENLEKKVNLVNPEDKKIKTEITKNIQEETIAEDKKNIFTKPMIEQNYKIARINNCFTNADKNELKKLKDDWILCQAKATNQIKGLISDTIPVAASNDYAIIVTNITHQDNELNLEIKNIEKEFEKIIKRKIKLIFLSNEDWLKEKEKYIANIKKGYKYSLMEEKENVFEENELEKLANSLFDSSKLEIK